MGNDYFSQYKSPNILIVPNMSFIKESPVKIMSSKKASVHNENVKTEINNSEVREKNNEQTLSKVSDERTQNRSLAYNYSQTIGQPKDKTEKLRPIKRKKELEESEKKLIQLPKKLKKDCKSREDSKSNVNVLCKNNRNKVDLTNKKGISNTSSKSKTGMSKVSAKYNDNLGKICQKEIDQHIEQSKSVKSIVKTTKSFQNIDKKNDLRLKLKRKLESANNDVKRKKEKKSSVKYGEDFSKFKRDHLFVTIKNERTDTSLQQKDNKDANIHNNEKNINLLHEKENYTGKKEKYNDLLIEKNKIKSPKKLESNKSTKENTIKKLQLIINVTYTKQATSPPKTVKGDDKCALATEDLSFLDDFNVDEIVDSLKKCENESNTNETYSSNNYINLFNDQESKQTNVISNVNVGTNKISNSEDIYSEITRKLAAFDAVKTFSSARIRNDIAKILIDERTIEDQPSNMSKMDGETKKSVAPLKQYHVKQKDKLPLPKICGVQLEKASPKTNNIVKASSLKKKLIDLNNETFPKENKNIQLRKASRTKTRIEQKSKGPLKENNIVQMDRLSLIRIKKNDKTSSTENNIAHLEKVCPNKNLNNVSVKEKNISQLDKASTRTNGNQIKEKNETSPNKNITVQKDSSKKIRIGQNRKTFPKEKKIKLLGKDILTKTRIEQNNHSLPIGNNIGQLDAVSLKKNLIEQKNKVLAKEKNIALLDEASVKKNRGEQKNETPPKEKRKSQFGKISLLKIRIEQNNEAPPLRNNTAQIDQVSLKKILTEQKNEVFAKEKNIALLDEAPVKNNRIEQKNETHSEENNTVQLDKVSLKKTRIGLKNETLPKEKRNSQFGKVSLTKTRIEQNSEAPPLRNNTAQIDQVSLKRNLIEQKNEVSAKERYIAQVDEAPLKKNRIEQKNEVSAKEKNIALLDEASVKNNRIEQKNETHSEENNTVQLDEDSLKKTRIGLKNETLPEEKRNSQFGKVSLTKTGIEQNSEAPPLRNNTAQIEQVSLKRNLIEQKDEVSAKEKYIAQVDEAPLKKNRIEPNNEVSAKDKYIAQVDEAPLHKNRIEQKIEVSAKEKYIAQVDEPPLKKNRIEQKDNTPPKENNVDQASLKENEIKHNFEDLNKYNIVQIPSLMEIQIELKKEDKKSEFQVNLDQIEQKKDSSLKVNQPKQINNVQLTENLINKTNKIPLNENINDHKKNLKIDINNSNNTTEENPKKVEVVDENSTNKIIKTTEVPIKPQTLRNNSKTEVNEENSKQLLDSCLDAEETYMIQDIGKRLHQKYSITNIIHRGKFSRILQCKNSKGKNYIFKILRKKGDNFLLGLSKYRMLKSIQEGIPINNYNLVSIVESCYILSHWCFVMDYYPKNLGQMLEKVDLDINQVQTLARQLVTAVTVLRNNGILHSDIKPSHILIDETNKRLKLCGFDRALYIEDVVLTKDIGTINYRAPEIIMGHSAGFSVDVWSTAVVLYEMVTKRQLFPGKHDNDILYKQMCTLGELPWDMVEDSYHAYDHFFGSKFMRTVGSRICFVNKFYTSNRLRNTLLLQENINWSNAKSHFERGEIWAKLNMFFKLLQQMLVLHPRHRIPIEFVYINPFIYQMSSDDDIFR